MEDGRPECRLIDGKEEYIQAKEMEGQCGLMRWKTKEVWSGRGKTRFQANEMEEKGTYKLMRW